MNIIKYGMLLLVLSMGATAQKTISFGISGTYNFPVETVGAGLRANIPVSSRFSFVPRMKYAPKFNSIHEVETGANVQFDLWDNSTRSRSPKPVIYVSAGALYNHWINYFPNNNSKAKKNNILPETGAGIIFGGNKIKGFAEGHWNILWNESYGEAGILFYPFSKNAKKMMRCP